MDTFTIMVVSSAMQNKSGCYLKVVEENYYCDLNEVVFPKIHLIFLSKRDYNKINEIEKLIKRYFELEEKYLKTEKKFIIYYDLKEIIRQLKEYGVMEVFSDHIEAFHLEFHYISQFIYNEMELKLPQRPMLSWSDEEFTENTLSHYEEENKNEKYFKKISKVIELLMDKIRYE